MLREWNNNTPGLPQLPKAISYPRFLPVGDSAVSVEFGDAIAPELNEAVVGLDIALAASEIDGIIETVPSYRSLLVCYEPLEINFCQLVDQLRGLLSNGSLVKNVGTTDWIVPVVYDPPYADDLPEVAHRLGLPEEAVIALHTGANFQVYAVGFAPGLPYLGGLPEPLHISRRASPRSHVPVGAIMIGGTQALIVSIPLPTGWYVLGRTPLRPFEPEREDPFLFRAGDHVRFRRIDAAEFDRLANLTSDALLPLVQLSR
jgi:KipI family sensor histidine kinase inhibitor